MIEIAARFGNGPMMNTPGGEEGMSCFDGDEYTDLTQYCI